jgi:hypothetical protein
MVDQHIDDIKRDDVVPPDCGDENRVAGLEFGDLSGGESLLEPWGALEIRIFERDHAYRCAGGRVLERPM